MKLFKCYNCTGDDGMAGVDFFAEKPVCPTCKLDGAEPRFAGRIVQCRIIHFDPPHPVAAGAGLNHLACDPTKKIGKVNVVATGVPDVVNCPACRETEAWKAAKKANETDDVPGITVGGLASEILKKG